MSIGNLYSPALITVDNAMAKKPKERSIASKKPISFGKKEGKKHSSNKELNIIA